MNIPLDEPGVQCRSQIKCW